MNSLEAQRVLGNDLHCRFHGHQEPQAKVGIYALAPSQRFL
jgi:hypothetical protein